MSAPPPPQPLYLQCEPDPAFATVHRAADQNERDTAVILCPPFGWDEVCSYRSLRFWAVRLAQDGYATIRLSLPSTGDSGGCAHDADRVGAWVAAVRSAADWLRAAAGARRVVAVGIGVGGVLAYLAAADGSGIDDLVLWGTPARGRALLRQLRAFSKLETTLFFDGLEPPPALPVGDLEAGGFVLSAETVQQLEQVKLDTIELPPATERRALLLERDGLPVDAGLREHLERGGAAVTVAPGDGFGDMTSHPQQARPPLQVIERVRGWLDEGSAPAGAPAPGGTAAGSVTSAELELRDGTGVRETPVRIEQSFGELSAVLVEPIAKPAHRLCVVLLNAGAVRRTGPNRMWVEAARRWAGHGVPTLRLDVEGIGDADGGETRYSDDGAFFAPTLVPQVLSALDFLQDRGVGERFVLGGLCASANWAFHAALCDPRVSGVMLINLRALASWDPGLGPARDLRALFSQPFSVSRIRRVATGPRLRLFLRWMLAAPGRRLGRLALREDPAAAAEREIDSALDAVLASGKRVLLLFSEHEPLYDEFTRSGRTERLRAAPNVTIDRIRVRDHTLRPSWAQRQAHLALDRALVREPDIELEAIEPAPVSPLEAAPPPLTA